MSEQDQDWIRANMDKSDIDDGRAALEGAREILGRVSDAVNEMKLIEARELSKEEVQLDAAIKGFESVYNGLTLLKNTNLDLARQCSTLSICSAMLISLRVLLQQLKSPVALEARVTQILVHEDLMSPLEVLEKFPTVKTSFASRSLRRSVRENAAMILGMHGLDLRKSKARLEAWKTELGNHGLPKSTRTGKAIGDLEKLVLLLKGFADLTQAQQRVYRRLMSSENEEWWTKSRLKEVCETNNDNVGAVHSKLCELGILENEENKFQVAPQFRTIWQREYPPSS